MEKIWTKPFDDISKQKATDKAELLSQLRLEKIQLCIQWPNDFYFGGLEGKKIL